MSEELKQAQARSNAAYKARCDIEEKMQSEINKVRARYSAKLAQAKAEEQVADEERRAIRRAIELQGGQSKMPLPVGTRVTEWSTSKGESFWRKECPPYETGRIGIVGISGADPSLRKRFGAPWSDGEPIVIPLLKSGKPGKWYEAFWLHSAAWIEEGKTWEDRKKQEGE